MDDEFSFTPESAKIEKKDNPYESYFFHHARPLQACPYDEVRQTALLLEEDDESFQAAYKWLEEHVGFYPLFMAVGNTEYDLEMTGYNRQFVRRLVGSKWTPKEQRVYRKKVNFRMKCSFHFPMSQMVPLWILKLGISF